MKGPQDRRNGEYGYAVIGDVCVGVKFNLLPAWPGDRDCPGYAAEMDISEAWTQSEDARRNGLDFYPVLVALGISDKFDAEVYSQLEHEGSFVQETQA